MNWKNWLSAFLENSAMFFIIYIFIRWTDRKFEINIYGFFVVAVMVIASSMGTIGSEELKRGGHQTARRIWKACILIPITVLFVLIITDNISYNKPIWTSAIGYLCFSSFVLLATSYPMALYLNRNQKKSTSQPTTDNAS